MFRKQAAEAQASVASAATAINVEMGEALRDLAQEDDAGWHGDWCPWRRWRGGGGDLGGSQRAKDQRKAGPEGPAVVVRLWRRRQSAVSSASVCLSASRIPAAAVSSIAR